MKQKRESEKEQKQRFLQSFKKSFFDTKQVKKNHNMLKTFTNSIKHVN